MEIASDQCTTVLLGSWNSAIFTPDWVRANVFPEDELAIDIQFGPPAIWRFTARGVGLEILPNRIQSGALSNTDEAIDAAVKAAVAVLKRLPETPMQAVGVNFTFKTHTQSDALATYLRSISSPLATEGLVSTSGASMSIPFGSGRINIILRTSNDEIERLEVNYHWDGRKASALADSIAEQDYQQLRSRATQLASAFLDMKAKS